MLPAGQAPPPEVIAALFRAWDTDGSGLIDKAELVGGCQALCAGDEGEKLRLAFSCFDADGDGHLTQPEVAKLLRGSIASSVTALHAGFEFAGEGADLAELEDEAGAAGASLEEQPDGTIVSAFAPAVCIDKHMPSFNGFRSAGYGHRFLCDFHKYKCFEEKLKALGIMGAAAVEVVWGFRLISRSSWAQQARLLRNDFATFTVCRATEQAPPPTTPPPPQMLAELSRQRQKAEHT